MADLGPQFHIRALYEKRAQRDAAKLKTYNQLLQQIYKKITYITRMRPELQRFVYIVPEYIPGGSIVNTEDASAYLILRLNSEGFDVIYIKPNLLDISWATHEEKYHRDMNPFASVLNASRIGEPVAATATSTVTVAAEPRTFTDMPVAATTTAATQPPAAKKTVNLRRVEDYVPSRSFF